MTEALRYFRFKGLLQKEGWILPAYAGVDRNGIVRYLSSKAPGEGAAVEAVEGFALPGFQNTHSHAFQYAMAGLAESHPKGIHDDFWTWREAMYRCALSVNPDQMEAIAAMLYSEMLRHGYTHVAEFHYLHHDKDGRHYGNPAEMSERIVAAASTAGIGLTLLPVFYQSSNFGLPFLDKQRRFISKSCEEYFKLFEASSKVIQNYSRAAIGLSVHSLRAVALEDIIETAQIGPVGLPFHLHVAEQKKEVIDCLNFCGKRPMQWVLDNLPLNKRFHLVHSTHLDDDELRRLAGSGAGVVLCPSTEGNLGDGIFRMKEFIALGGRWSLGTDSHIGLNPLEEFRMIDYRQRLVTNARNTADGNAAQYFVNEEVYTGRVANGITRGDHFEPGLPFDAVVYDAAAPLLEGTSPDSLLPTIVYSGDQTLCMGTIVSGEWIVRNQKHRSRDEIALNFANAMGQLKNR